jgi:cytochrome P450
LLTGRGAAAFLTVQFKANPYPFYARLRDEAPVCRISAFLTQGWLVTRYDDVLMLLKDEVCWEAERRPEVRHRCCVELERDQPT